MSDIDISYGGQAVIGGVLIQSPKGWSLGIRDKDDNLHRYYEPRIPLVRRNKFWAAPFIRGFGALIDSMYVGFKAITLSEKIYSKFEDEEEVFLDEEGNVIKTPELIDGEEAYSSDADNDDNSNENNEN